MFKAKKVDINSKGEVFVFIHENDANELSLQANERVKVFKSDKKNRNIVCEVKIIGNSIDKGGRACIKKNEIGLVESTFTKLNLIPGSKVSIAPASKPKSIEYVKRKFNGGRISAKEFEEIIQEIVDNKYSKVEITYFVLACTAHKLNMDEIIGLTKAMVNVGKSLNFKTNKNDIIVDKHCIGGVPNNRTTMLVVPIIAAAGLKIPKTSSRSITSPAGTADTMEVLANVDIGLSDMYSMVNKINGCIIWGGALDLSPADDLIINVEHPLEIDSEGQMIASILSKKKSAGSTHVLIDIPIGKTAKVKSYFDALKLKRKFEKVGKAIDLNIKVIITDGSQPIGEGIGPLNEALDVISILENRDNSPNDLKEKSLNMAGLIFEMSNKCKKGKGYNLAKEILESGKALEKFNEILEFQGKKKIPKEAKIQFEFKAKKDGKIKEIHNKKISKLAFILGAPEDSRAGLRLYKKSGDSIKKGETILRLYTNSKQKLNFAINYIEDNEDFIIY